MNDNKFIFNNFEWSTPNSYDTDFKPLPTESGIYLLVRVEFKIDDKSIKHTVLYVGSSSNLKRRYSHHEVLNKLLNKYEYVRFYFRTTEDYISLEKKLIKLIQPKYNIQGKN